MNNQDNSPEHETNDIWDEKVIESTEKSNRVNHQNGLQDETVGDFWDQSKKSKSHQKPQINQNQTNDNLIGDSDFQETEFSNLEGLDFLELPVDDTEDLLPFIQENKHSNYTESELDEILELDSPDNIEFNFDDFEQEISLQEIPSENDSIEEIILESETENSQSLDDLLDFNLNTETSLEELVSMDTELDLSDASNELTGLEDLLSEPGDFDELDELENLLDSELNGNKLETELVLDLDESPVDLDNLLDFPVDSIPSASIKTKQITPPSQIPEPQGQVFDQTMRVSVKKLDNLNNMIGELVVKRNRLEEDQERLRRFLDNLLSHVQSLGEMGAKMHDLYERSLLEGALIASRQQSQASSRRVSSFLDTGIKEDKNDGLDALELDRFTGFHLLSQDIIELIVRVREAASDIQFVVDETDKVTQSLRQVTSQLQDGMNSSRMVAFGQTTDRLPRAVRDISRQLKKQVNLKVDGKEVLIDKMIVENLYNPMTHLVNNAITHGIETLEERRSLGKPEQGTIHIRAFLQGNQTVITISDDGAGIDPKRVKAKAVEKNLLTWAQAQSLSQQDVYDLLFHPGFSTKDQADDFAGRGVGMDVVSTDLKKIRGTISIESEVGKGTTFTVRLPLVLSICKALSCVFNNTRIAFPIDGVEDTGEYALTEIQTNSNGVKCISWNNSLLPFQPLNNLLSYNRRISRAGIYNINQEEDTISIIVLRSSDNLLAIEVDQVLGEQEIVIKQIEGPVPKPPGIAGATVLGDGTIMAIGDVLELIEIAQGKRTTELGFNLWETESDRIRQAENSTSEPMVLVVDDSITVRELLTLSFNKLGYRVEQARDGQEAWDKLRGGLPCDMIFCDIEMPRMNGLELLSNVQKDEKLKLIPVAMLTSRGAEKHRKLATDLGAQAYLTKPYTEKDLMDVAQRLIEVNRVNKQTELMVVHAKSKINQEQEQKLTLKTNPLVLIIDDSVTVRELLSMTFKKAGYRVEQARDGQEAWDKLREGLECDIAFCDIEMPRMNGLELLSNLQQDINLSTLPIAMLTSRGAQKMRNIAAKRGAKGYFVKPYVEETLLDAAQKMMRGEILIEQIDLEGLEEEDH